MSTVPASSEVSATKENPHAILSRIPHRCVTVGGQTTPAAIPSPHQQSKPDDPSHQTNVMSGPANREVFNLFQLGVFNVPQFVGAGLLDKKSVTSPPPPSTAETVELVELVAGASYEPHVHDASAAVIYIIIGTGEFILGDETVPYAPGQRIVVNCGVQHGFQTKETTLFLSIQSPPIINPITGQVDIHYRTHERASTEVPAPAASASPTSSNPSTTKADIQQQENAIKSNQPETAASTSNSVSDSSAPEVVNDATADRSIRLGTRRKVAGESTGIPGNMGLDHYGIVVPNVREACKFLCEVFDADIDWEVLREPKPTSGERGWDEKFDVHPDSFMPHVVMLKCGDDVLTQYIELFEWSSPDQYQPSKQHRLTPGWNKFSDIGNSYFSFTVKDLSAVMDHCRRNVFTQPAWSHCRFVQDPPMNFPLRGEVCNSTFLISPWGQWIELTCWSKSKLLKDVITCQRAIVRDERIGRSIFDLSTPSFMVDLDIIDHNIRLLKERIVDRGLMWRIPAKAHKCPELARYIMTKGGACGVVLLTLKEVESFANAGIEDIYLANQVYTADDIRRLSLVAKKIKRLRVSVDSIDYLRALATQLESWEQLSPMEVLVELDVNHHRLGVGVEQAVEIAKVADQIQKTTGSIIFKGVTGYEGHTPILPPDEKLIQTKASHSILQQAKLAIEKVGIPVEIVSGGGSCNYTQSLEAHVLNEFQVGGGAIGDSLYSDKGGLKSAGHLMGALVFGQIISAPDDDPTRATANAGFKAVGWHPFGGLPLLRDYPHIRCNGLSAEHTRLIGVDLKAMEAAATAAPATTVASSTSTPPAPIIKAPIHLKRGDKVVLIPGYTDAMGLFHREIFAIRKDRVEAVWSTQQ